MELLLDNTLSISDVASTLSYSDQSHFSKAFKKMVGVSPMQYRKAVSFHKSFR